MNYFIIVSGPTAVGKTDFVDNLGSQLSVPYEIINADVGQLYTPLSIGTAKPSYKNSPLQHHLFDVLDTPRSYTVSQWREAVLKIMHSLWNRECIPVIVGGSAFISLHSFSLRRELNRSIHSKNFHLESFR